jgi:hypothetical protein
LFVITLIAAIIIIVGLLIVIYRMKRKSWTAHKSRYQL